MLLLLLAACFPAAAQDLIRSVPLNSARFMSTDELGNVYVVQQDNALVRYDAAGDSTGNFRSIQNGELQWVDATNPLRVLLYYPAFSRILLLDRMLSVKNELDLKKLSLFNAPATGISADGRIWVYDQVNARLKKIDDQLNITNTSNDMRQESETVPQPRSLLEREGRVYLCDPVNGIYTFDRFASYINTLEFRGLDQVQAFGTQLIYRSSDTLFAYNLKTLSLRSIPLPPAARLLQARVERGRLYLLYPERLDIYRTNNDE